MGSLLLSLPLTLAVALGTAPQGVPVVLARLDAPEALSAEAQTVTQALTRELTGQGYEVRAGASASGRARVDGRLERKDGQLLLTLRLTRLQDGAVLTEEKLPVAETKQLEPQALEGARRLASELRQAFGVRARIRL